MEREDKDIYTADATKNLEEISKYDPDFRFRTLSGITAKLAFLMTQVLSIFAIYTAGFGVLQEWRHRAFYLAFVLPLVYFLYSIRKPDTRGSKYFVYDIIYGLIGAALSTTMFHEILALSTAASFVFAIITFLFIIYVKRRQFLGKKIFIYIDFALFTAMIGGFFFGVFRAYFSINFIEVFNAPNMTLLFWSILLFATFLSILLLFILHWVRALLAIISTGSFNYRRDDIPYFDIFLVLMSAAFSVFIFLEYNNLVFRAGMPLKLDLVVGAFAILLILEGARRSIGTPLPIIALLVLINCYLAPYFLDIPGLSFFAHRGYSVERIIEHMFLGTEGIYGIPVGVVATFVFHFVLFGIFISKTGLGQLFMDLAMALAGWSAGGPAKVSVISSGFMGSISGSSIANTVTTGAFTIPLMRKVGYRPQFAGAVEASASTGGQLMPPIMGAAAFIMSEFLGIPYIKIAAAAVIPAVLHFFSIAMMVHFEAKKSGLVGIPRENLPRTMNILKGKWHLIVPLIIIVWLLISGSSPFLAAFWGIFFTVAIGQIHDKTTPFLITIILATPAILLRYNPLIPFTMGTVVWIAFFVLGFAYTLKKTDMRNWLICLSSGIVLVLLQLFNVDSFLSAFWTLA
ncbi:MAG: TRAP transporter fused permease subunit, partial [Deltaproteobacteria bacterium]|nr:TRAP transporter fused permease subunit [Deltaproteobacteria bacterium]